MVGSIQDISTKNHMLLMDKGSLSFQILPATMDYGRKDKCMDRAIFLGMMAPLREENISMAENTESAHFYFPQESTTRANGSMESRVAMASFMTEMDR